MKPLLFIPFLALLATSCGGGQITTTPVVKNAPSVSLTRTRQGLNVPSGYVSTALFQFECPTTQETKYYNLLDGTELTNIVNIPLVIQINPTSLRAKLYYYSKEIFWGDYVPNLRVNGDLPKYVPSNATFPDLVVTWHDLIQGTFTAKPYETGYNTGYKDGIEDGYNLESNKLIPNGQYTGLTIYPKRNYLETLAVRVLSNNYTPTNGNFDLIDTNANYTIYIKWTYDATNKKTTFQDSGNEIIGELFWENVAKKNWSTSWFYLYNAELHYFAPPKTYATNNPIDTSFYPEVYIGSTFTGGDPNTYFAGGGNAYQMGFVDGQTYTIHASDTYQNVFSIFTPAFKAVADFFNLNIGPFKVWYFFAIPLIVTLLILVLRLVKH